MCGRYALALRPAQIRQALQESNMPSQWEPDNDAVRQTYNFAPGYYGIVYREDVRDPGTGRRAQEQEPQQEPQQEDAEAEQAEDATADAHSDQDKKQSSPQYKLQAMKWGLIPFWTKRNPDYGSMMRTINCRDDSLATQGGMWQTMKQNKRCIVIAQGFYEWLKKNNGKEKIPHYVKRKDGKLMCFAGLWDSVKYEDADEKLYTYTIITTDVNQQLGFLHDRMPVIFDNGSEDLFKWLDSGRSEWSMELQSLLKPYKGELECYPVVKDVGKVGNNSPTFIVPVNSSQNKQNIANFFGKQKQASTSEKQEVATERSDLAKMGTTVEHDKDEQRDTKLSGNDSENNAPEPSPVKSSLKREHDEDQKSSSKAVKVSSPAKTSSPVSSKKSRSATSNNSGSPTKAGTGSRRIDGFFKPK